MKLLLDANTKSVLIYCFIFIISCIIIFKTMKKFNMHIASTCFLVLSIIIGAYIPFYFGGSIIMKYVSNSYSSSFGFYFLKNQLATINAPFFLFESGSLLTVLLAIISVIALIIMTVHIIKFVIKLINNSYQINYLDLSNKNNFINRYIYIPNYHYTYLKTRRLRR